MFLALWSLACRDLPPLGEAQIVMDTDMPVPSVVNTLRVDLYLQGPEGLRWFDSREVGVASPEELPASFSVYAPDGRSPATVLVRVRAYHGGYTRAYRGERYEGPVRLSDGAPDDILAPAETPIDQTLRLVVDGIDVTPLSEPLPRMAIDMLRLIRLQEGAVGRVPVHLVGTCAGIQADLANLRSCTRDQTLEPTTAVTPSESTTDATVLTAGTFPLHSGLNIPARCDEPAVEAERRKAGYEEERCIPGGIFFRGDRVAARTVSDQDFEVVDPPSIAVVPRFLMDRFEVTVGEYRRALTEGLLAPRAFPNERDALSETSEGGLCTFSTTPRGRENLPLNCVSFETANAYCTFRGGRVPSSAEWVYAATNAWQFGPRGIATSFPWGNQTPLPCDAYVHGRMFMAGDDETGCAGPAPLPVDFVLQVGERPADVNGVGIVGLSGNVQELVTEPYGLRTRCALSTDLIRPSCFASSQMSVRGGVAWASPVSSAKSAPDEQGTFLTGFRCVRTPSIDRAP